MAILIEQDRFRDEGFTFYYDEPIEVLRLMEAANGELCIKLNIGSLYLTRKEIQKLTELLKEVK